MSSKNFKILSIGCLIALGLFFHWLQIQSKNSSKLQTPTKGFSLYEDIQPFARKAHQEPQEISMRLREKSLKALKEAQKLRGRLFNETQEEATPESEEYSFPHAKKTGDGLLEVTENPEGSNEETAENDEDFDFEFDEEGNIIAKKDKENGKDKEEDEYDEDGNLIVKKDKKKKSEYEEDEAPESEVAKEETEKDDDKDTEEPNTQEVLATGVGGSPAPPPEEEQEEMKGYDAWAALILTQPNSGAVSQLVEYYQTSRVSKEIFYRLVTEMLSDSRIPMKLLGVRAAGTTSSIDSFVLLSEVLAGEGYNSEVAASARQFLNQYTTMAHLSVLAKVLRSSSEQVSPQSQILAADLLETAARNHLVTRGQASEGENSSQEVKELAQMQKKFEPFLEVLEQFIASGSDSEAITVAQRTLSQLKDLLQIPEAAV